eukprot:gnl/TRDRNA2_/TRDRNA2_128014_c1_seq1.p2 gnl/TRDRNA2_/TRDRNA2_128014_c1~~gnl/TRDRNA2_/TRDRNA2_128014_c1_seq1.p2  ORF type:complete len:181 (-),score=29.95 gnl/TRDRNA2_/TRDRNA2_128014_c1_seq1:19-513(-)
MHASVEAQLKSAALMQQEEHRVMKRHNDATKAVIEMDQSKIHAQLETVLQAFEENTAEVKRITESKFIWETSSKRISAVEATLQMHNRKLADLSIKCSIAEGGARSPRGSHVSGANSDAGGPDLLAGSRASSPPRGTPRASSPPRGTPRGQAVVRGKVDRNTVR